MALRGCDSFDHYTTVTQKWDTTNGGSITSAAARNGIAGFRSAGNQLAISRLIRDANGNPITSTNLIAGVALRTNAPSGNGVALLSFMDNSTNFPTAQVSLALNSDGTVSAQRQNTTIAIAATLGTSTKKVPNLTNSVWHYYEMKAFIATAGAGTVEIRVDGIVYLTLTGVTTVQSANAYANSVMVCLTVSGVSFPNPADFDDFYICDNTGTTNNDYLGDVTVSAVVPNGNGSVNNFSIGGTSPAATNWQSVREIPPDDGVTLVQSSSAGAIDRYTYPALVPTPGTPYAVVAWPRVAKDVSGGRSARVSVKSGATTTDNGADLVLSQSYQYFGIIFEQDPNTSAQWALSAINAAEFGVKVI